MVVARQRAAARYRVCERPADLSRKCALHRALMTKEPTSTTAVG
jgi:hypothetical protein